MTTRPPTRRLFIAVPLPVDVRTAVSRLVDEVRRGEVAGSRVRWVRMDGLHLTIRFLGPTSEDRIGPIEAAIDRLAAGHASFAVRIEGAGGFPDPTRPRALWLGIAGGREALTALAADTGSALADLGWPADDRPYRAHLTLARTDGARDGPATVARLEAAAASLDLAFRATTLALMESHTGHGPARYDAVHVAELAGEPSGP